MRKTIIIALVLSLVIVATPLGGPALVGASTPATLHVVGPGGQIGPGTLCPPIMARGAATFQTIQKACDCALPGDTIIVDPGTYNESVRIEKSLTLLGAQAGVCAIDRTGDESIIDPGVGAANPSAIAVTVFDVFVTIDGFKIIGSRGAVKTRDGSDDRDVNEFHFLNNIVQANSSEAGTNVAAMVYIVSNITEVQCNDISPTPMPATTDMNALRVLIKASNPPTVDVHYNRLHNASASGFGFTGDVPSASINVTYNDMYDNTDDGMWTYNSCFFTLNVTNNNIHDNGLKGIKIASGIACNPTGIDINVNCNNIYDNGEEGLYNNINNPLVDAENNWWGDPSGPEHTPVLVCIDCKPPSEGGWNCDVCDKNPDGLGDKVSDDVDYCPWLDGPWEVTPPCGTLPAGESTNSVGAGKDVYTTGEPVYATGDGFPTNAYVDVYIVGDLAWAKPMAIPPDVSSDGMNSVLTDANGNLGSTNVWPPPLVPGEYDMVFDVNRNGIYDNGDVVDDPAHPGFRVLAPPAVGGEAYPVNKLGILAPWIALAMLLIGSIAWFTLRHRRAQS